MGQVKIVTALRAIIGLGWGWGVQESTLKGRILVNGAKKDEGLTHLFYKFTLSVDTGK